MNLKNCKLKKASKDDYNHYFIIRSEKKNLFWTGYDAPPDFEKFKDWFINRINDLKRDLYLLYCKNECAGSLNIDYYTNNAFIGYSVKEQFEGKGLATFIVSNAIEIIKNNIYITNIKAWINENNIGSIKVAEKNNMKKTGKTEKRVRFGKKELYYEFGLELKNNAK